MKDVLYMTGLKAVIFKPFPLLVLKVIVFQSVSHCFEATLNTVFDVISAQCAQKHK